MIRFLYGNEETAKQKSYLYRLYNKHFLKKEKSLTDDLERQETFYPKGATPIYLVPKFRRLQRFELRSLSDKNKKLNFHKKRLMKSILFSNIPVWGGDLCFRRNVSHAGIVVKTYIVLKILWNIYVKE